LSRDRARAPRPRCRPVDEHALEHAALAAPVRLALLETLVTARSPRSLEHLVEAVDRHPSTVRGHLALLEDAGLVESVPEHLHTPGRPRVLYQPTLRARGRALGCSGYRTVAHVLTAYLAREAPDPSASGERAGRAWAADLTRAEPRGHPSDQAPLERVRDLLVGVGLPAEVHEGRDGLVLAHRGCPLAGLADQHAGIACGLHLGLVRGLLEGLDAPLEAAGFSSDVEEGTCTIQVRPRRPRL
jgi:predicted ArsR family transcriptional regulator